MAVSLKNGYLKQLQNSVPTKKRAKQIVILNLMPNRLETEKQFASIFNDLDGDVELTFMYAATHHFKGVARDEIAKTYVNLAQIDQQYFDGLIITGAPVEKLDYAQVDYFAEFRAILRWAKTHVNQTLLECWAAQAGLNHYYATKKYVLPQKLFGVFGDEVTGITTLTKGIGQFIVPHSRHSNVLVKQHVDLKILIKDAVAGPVLLQDVKRRVTFMQGHPEYFADTLWHEFERDLRAGKQVAVPQNYEKSSGNWLETSHKFYQNWLDLMR
ncbi:homoserine O-acetyltransferase/O-succinyltransferase family protein [Periweissella cryptocerci]|nr:homoserine O-succinyltransferase [Periweissella cryptocerci]